MQNDIFRYAEKLAAYCGHRPHVIVAGMALAAVVWSLLHIRRVWRVMF